ncbi:hypothetical protein GCM10011346_48220 [Oceanobacillus neutriphilus]|uniref:Uncharacterized protein n=1 Tax=Oceanobacillus neutriphilus TaxID=531815 RepID=A0ABQ2P2C3_9BACI|nr:hypothetical protein GCM10011346_48220 [Oceanobacillus neutriphilus]
MVKVLQKISGTFRDPKEAELFGRIWDYISTLKKESHSVIDALHSVMTGKPFLPDKNN